MEANAARRESSREPVPLEGDIHTELGADFYEKQMRSPNPLRRWFHTSRYRTVNSLVKAHAAAADMTVVDLGCGSCDWNTDGLNVIGVDINPGLLETGRRRGRLVQCRQVDARSTGLPDGSADVVVAAEFLEHLSDYRPVLREMHRVLKPGGRVVVSVPDDTWLSLWRPLFFCQVLLQGYLLGSRYYRQRCGHVQHFSRSTLSQAFSTEGFRVDRVFSIRGFSLFLVASKGEEVGDGVLPCPDLTLILPSLNEARFIGHLLEALTTSFPGARIIVADDGSEDGTQQVVREYAARNVVLLDRAAEFEHGLTASVLAAAARVSTPFFVVMDADGQHPPAKVREFVALLRRGAKLVVGSRIEVEGHWPWVRRLVSRLGTALGRTSLWARGKQTAGCDILSGFLGLQTRFFQEVTAGRLGSRHFRMRGYKLLFDLLVLLPREERTEQVYYRFETRRGGTSKMNLAVGLAYLRALLRPGRR